MGAFEEYFIRHREGFQSDEPPDGHFERFRNRLNNPGIRELRPHRKILFMSIAAIALLLLGAVLFISAPQGLGFLRTPLHASSAIPKDALEAIEYYDAQAMLEYKEIVKLAGSTTEGLALSENALKEFRILDENYMELKKTLEANPSDDRITEAMIRNQKMKEGVMNTIKYRLTQAQNK